MDYKNTCIIGDFNAVVDAKKITDATKEEKIRGTLPKTFFEMIQEIGLQVTWRELNSKTNQFTFY